MAKLDRLARSTWLFANIQRTKIPFEIVGLPNNPLVLQILASVAEWEARAISERTKSALAISKAQGKKLGWHNPKVRRGIKKYWKAQKALRKKQVKKPKEKPKPANLKVKKTKMQKDDAKVWQTIRTLRRQGYSFEMIADALNMANVPSRLGGKWYQTSVIRVYNRNKKPLKK